MLKCLTCEIFWLVRVIITVWGEFSSWNLTVGNKKQSRKRLNLLVFPTRYNFTSVNVFIFNNHAIFFLEIKTTLVDVFIFPNGDKYGI